MAETDTKDTPLLFCPFCRECFEGTARCPDHDLVLLAWEELPKRDGDDVVLDSDPLAPVDPRFGRAEVGIAALLLLGGFVCPLFTVSSADAMSDPRTFSALAAAADEAPNLWTLPFVGVLALSLVLRRRTPASMRGARLVCLLLGAAVPASLAYTMERVYQGARDLSAAHSYAFHVSLEWGLALPLVASVLLFVGAVRFGVLPHEPAAGPASADPEASPAPSAARKKRKR